MSDFAQVAGVLGTLLIAAIAFLKSRPEANKLHAETSLTYVEAQSRIIDDLQTELVRAQENIEMLRTEKDAEIEALRVALEAERRASREDYQSLLAEHRQLKAYVEKLKGNNG